jgi:tRNA pseudouridine55 synthase
MFAQGINTAVVRTTELPEKIGDSAVGGLVVLNKPTGISSRKLVDQVARCLPRSKVGHAGTLDPLASGILIVCVGPATRLVQNVQDLSKSYTTLVRLGARSDTLDADGCIEVEMSPTIPTSHQVEEAIRPFTGIVIQTPPAYSAKKIQGKRAYELARAGQTLELAPCEVRIDRIHVIDYTWPHLHLEIDCGGGTYIRSIARDIGDALGCGGLVETLIRTRTGPFTLEQAFDPSELSRESIHRCLRPAIDAVPDLTQVVLDDDQVKAVIQGKRLPAGDLRGEWSGATGQIALLDPEGRLIALAELNLAQGWVQPRKVLV